MGKVDFTARALAEGTNPYQTKLQLALWKTSCWIIVGNHSHEVGIKDQKALANSVAGSNFVHALEISNVILFPLSDFNESGILLQACNSGYILAVVPNFKLRGTSGVSGLTDGTGIFFSQSFDGGSRNPDKYLLGAVWVFILDPARARIKKSMGAHHNSLPHSLSVSTSTVLNMALL